MTRTTFLPVLALAFAHFSRAFHLIGIQHSQLTTRSSKCNQHDGFERSMSRMCMLPVDSYEDNHVDPRKEGVGRRNFLTRSLSAALAISAVSTSPNKSMASAPATTLIQSPVPLISSSSSSSTVKVMGETFQETISGFVSGAALTTTKTFVKYPLDTATVRLQMPNSTYSILRPGELFDGSYSGIVLPLLSNIPGGGVFFAIKDATKSLCKDAGMPKWMATSIAVGVANFPYWLIRNPSEVIKTRQQAKIEGYVSVSDGRGGGESVSALAAIKTALNNTDSESGGVKGLYTGYWENIIYAYPADLLKFLSYEALSGGRKNLSPSEGAAYGAAATAIAQYFTTPLDVVRNRIMAGKDTTGIGENSSNQDYISRVLRIAREEGVTGLFAGASPRVGKALLSGAIQFATYEETKQSITALFQSKK